MIDPTLHHGFIFSDGPVQRDKAKVDRRTARNLNEAYNIVSQLNSEGRETEGIVTPSGKYVIFFTKGKTN